MVRSYLRVALRNLANSKFYTALNIIGLSIGMSVAILIGIWVWDELSFNNYHTNHRRLGEIASIETFNGTTTTEEFSSVPIADALRTTYASAFKRVCLTRELNASLKAGNTKISTSGLWAEEAFPSMFTIRMIAGDLTGFRDPTSIFINATLAKSLFNNESPLNKVITINGQYNMVVSGVYEDIPSSSRFSGIEFLSAWNDSNNPGLASVDDWGDHHFQLFVELNNHVSFKAISENIRNLTKPHLKGAWEELMIYPMDRWHLYSDFKQEGRVSAGRIQFVWLFGLIGLFVLVLACINFVNLSTAKSAKRAKEVGIRKTMGSRRRQLVLQFLGESIFISSISLIIALVWAMLLLPLFNQLSGKQLQIPFSQIYFWICLLGFNAVTGILAGIYPAFFLSGFNPVSVLNGKANGGAGSALPRKILVVVQFTVCITLLIATVLVYRQVQYAKNRPVGYSLHNLLTVEIKSVQVKQHLEALKKDLLRTGAVENAEASSSPSTQVRNSMINYSWKGKDPNSMAIVGTVCVGYDFGKTINWQIVDGRDFSSAYASDSGAFILNEAAVQFTGLKHAVGESIHWRDVDHPIVGVVKNMIMESPYTAVQPTFFMLYNWKIDFMTVRLRRNLPAQQAISEIEKVFHRYDPENPFDYQFTSELHRQKFADEVSLGELSTFFCLLAALISGLGLFGLASYVAEQRKREVAVRKVLGAGIFRIWKLLSFEFFLLIVISCAIAFPMAWFGMHRWLEKYEYRSPINLWVFAIAGLGALAMTLMTVSYQTIRAASLNPVESLKSD